MTEKNKNLILDLILLDKYTKNIEHWNPFIEYKDINFFIGKSNYYILAPINIDNEEYLWNFRINCSNNNKIVMSTTSYSNNSDPCIDIVIENNLGKINYINNCHNHYGKNIIRWIISIMKHLGCTKCTLVDMANKKCNNRSFKNYVSLSLIHKLRKGITYYEEFDFIAYDKNNNQYEKSKIVELDKYVNELENIEWSKYSIQNEKWNIFYNLYSKYYPSPILAFKQFNEDNCGIFYDILYFLNQPDQPSYHLLTKINSIISKSVWMKLL
jgi:hypothetical protein